MRPALGRLAGACLALVTAPGCAPPASAPARVDVPGELEPVFGQHESHLPDWLRAMNQSAEPFRVIGNVYFVGTVGLGVFLIATAAGHILLDSGFESHVPLMAEDLQRLGFRLEDVEILLASHAHIDHVGGHSRVREVSGARVLISERDAVRVRAGGRGDFAYGDSQQFRACPTDGVIRDGDRVELGGTTLVAHLTPGHTEGATTWTMEVEEAGQRLQLVFFPSAGLHPEVRLHGNLDYPQIVDDFEQSFARWKTLPADVLLGSHTIFFDLARKREAQKAGSEPNPFINPEALPLLLEAQEQRFRSHLAAELP